MFIPIESIATSAFEARPDLQRESIDKRDPSATPITSIALLRRGRLYWRREELARNAQETWDSAHELHRRLGSCRNHLGKWGPDPETAARDFDPALGCFGASVLPQGRRIEDLSGSQGSDRLDFPKRIETRVRQGAGNNRDDDE
jgi:DNA anti-recombination protein RmuC